MNYRTVFCVLLLLCGSLFAAEEGDEGKLAAARQQVRLGETEFKAGRIAESLAAFDKAVELAPSAEPYLWQRGIAQYEAGKFAAGAKQFELHKTVNANDVENAAWHYLCVARAESPAAAVKKLIAIDTAEDRRVPMRQVYEMFAGKLGPEDVLKVVANADESRAIDKFYADLYVALWHEANGHADDAKKYMTLAAAHADSGGYMGDVAKIHLARMN
jgi:lipoprotein NlpI